LSIHLQENTRIKKGEMSSVEENIKFSRYFEVGQ
jgi:hypothetical protein